MTYRRQGGFFFKSVHQREASVIHNAAMRNGYGHICVADVGGIVVDLLIPLIARANAESTPLESRYPWAIVIPYDCDSLVN